MLKVIAGVLKPTDGSVRVYGDVAPLIELGTRIESDHTPRENIYMNRALF